ncbi:MAG: Uma2 family endonuclease [Thermoanaerobaculia bacterium]
MTWPATKLTYEDFCLFPDDGRRHEIIDGEHYLQKSPNTQHQRISANIVYAIHGYAETRGLGEVFFARLDVVLSEFDVLEPDIFYVSDARKHIITEANIQGAPDIVVEILSSSTRICDEIVKRKRYEVLGVPEYWIVDPELEVVKIYRRAGAQYNFVFASDTITTPLIPGFSLPLRDVFD